MIGMTLSGCANFTPAVRFARLLIAAEGPQAVAIVTADRCVVSEQRVAWWDLGILSDGAASCVVSGEAWSDSALQLMGLGHTGDPMVRDL